MPYNFPKIRLTKAQKTWINEIYKRSLKGDDLDLRVIRVALMERLPRDFDRNQIDGRLLAGTDLTLLGVWHVNPNSTIIEKTDSVIKFVREEIVKDPKMKVVTSTHISQLAEIPEHEVSLIFRLMRSFGDFWTSGASGSTADGTKWSSIDVSFLGVIEEYLSYENLEKQMLSFYNQEKFIKKRKKQSKEYFAEIDDTEAVNPNTAFILMQIDPNNPELDDISNAIKDVCGSFEISAIRADDIEHQEQITDVLLRQINLAEFLVADLTGERPNVYYEIGYAHAINKRPILVRKSGTKLHFDLSVHNAPEYRNITELKEILTRRFEAIIGKPPKQDNL